MSNFLLWWAGGKINCFVLPKLLKDFAVEKMIIVTIDQKSCKRILICGSACICSSVFGLFCIYHYSFPGLLQVIAHLYCFFWNWEDSTSKFCNRSSSCTIYLSVVKRFCWNKWRAKGVLGYTTKDRKLLLFLGLTKFNVRILRQKFFMRNFNSMIFPKFFS